MTAFTFRMPSGIAGDSNRSQSLSIETQVITPFGTTGAPTAYGIPVVIDATTHMVRSLVASDTTVYGVLVRPYPTNSSQDAVGTSTPGTQGACDVLVRGYISILLGGTAAAVKGAPVYVWTATSSGAHVQSTFEAVSTGGSTITMPAGWYFMGPADANGFTEIAVNI